MGARCRDNVKLHFLNDPCIADLRLNILVRHYIPSKNFNLLPSSLSLSSSSSSSFLRLFPAANFSSGYAQSSFSLCMIIRCFRPSSILFSTSLLVILYTYFIPSIPLQIYVFSTSIFHYPFLLNGPLSLPHQVTYSI